MKNFKIIIAFITLTILATIGLQVYWNIKNYNLNKNRLFNEVQIAFDNGIERYYVEDAKNDFVAFTADSSIESDAFLNQIKLDTIFKTGKINTKEKKTKKTTKIEWKVESNFNSQSITLGEKQDMINAQIDTTKIGNGFIMETYKGNRSVTTIEPSSIKTISVFKGRKSADSIAKIKDIANRIVISMIRDSIDFKKLSRNLNAELKRKNITVDYSIFHLKSNKIFDHFTTNKKAELHFKTESKSIYLPQNQQLKLAFSNPIALILKRSLIEITLSLLLSLSIIGCLLYLLKTIQKQKKVDEIKNDLISNITHEFKTPITTISTALEGIKNFNAENDTEKSNRYLAISGNQLKKLEMMVERLLETASLETDQLVLKKERVDMVQLIENNLEKHRLNATTKSIVWHSDEQIAEVFVDVFHFENVISNLVDNALKYGGNEIVVALSKTKSQLQITVEDNGVEIEKSQRKKIFDQFYRIPKGNIHDVKGFGIGLYYAKKIVEKHGGSLELVDDSKMTQFKIIIPYES